MLESPLEVLFVTPTSPSPLSVVVTMTFLLALILESNFCWKGISFDWERFGVKAKSIA